MASQTSEKEIRTLEKLLEERPESLLFARLADAYRKDGNINQAIELCINGIEQFPRYTTGRILLGRCYLEQQKLNEAVEAFTAACTIDRCNHVAIKMLADIFAQQGVQEKAGDLYFLLTLLDPDNAVIERLSSQFRTTGTTDIFTILGLTAKQPQRRAAPAAQPQPRYQQEPIQRTDESSDALPAGDDFSALFSSVEDVVPETTGAVTGDDLSDRMNSIFGETAPTPMPNAFEQPSYPEEQQYDIESVVADITSSSVDVSGEDVSNRIEELFTDGSFFRDEPVSENVVTDEQQEMESVSLVDQNFDFSGIDEEQQQSEQPEPLDAFLGESADTLAKFPSLEDQFATAIDGDADSSSDVVTPDFDINFLDLPRVNTPASDNVDGNDVADRLEDLFKDSDSLELSPTALSEDNAENSLNDSALAWPAADSETFGEQDISIIPTGNYGEPPSEDPTVIIDKKLNNKELESVGMVPTGFSDGTELSGDDIANRLDGLFSEDVTPDENVLKLHSAEEMADEEEQNLLFDLRDHGEDDHPAEQPVSENEVTGIDIIERLDAIVADSEPSISDNEIVEENVHQLGADMLTGNSFNLVPTGISDESEALDFSLPSYRSLEDVSGGDSQISSFSNELPEIIDTNDDLLKNYAVEEMDVHDETVEHEVSMGGFSIHDETIKKDGSETTFDQLLPTASQENELFSENLFEQTTVAAEENEAVENEDFTPPAFEETLQFDSALFEQMLNPIEESVEETDITPAFPESGSDNLHENDFEIIGAESLGESDTEENTLNNSTLLRSPAVSIDPVASFADNNEELSGSDLIIDSASSFEVATPQSERDVPDLLADADFPIEEELLREPANEPDESTFVNRIVSDNTEIIDLAPSGDDVVGQLDAMFPDAAVEKRREPGSEEVIDLTKEYLLDDIAEYRDDQPEEDAALIETIQFSKMNTTATILPDTIEDNSVQTTAGTPEEVIPEAVQNGGTPPISGSDVVDRLDTFFPASDLMSLSSTVSPLHEEEAEPSDAPIADFYTLSGNNAADSFDGALPEMIDEVEFVDKDTFCDDQTIDFSRDQIDAALAQGDDAGKPTTFSDEMLPQDEQMDDFPKETIQMDREDIASAMASVVDERDASFDIPDHVLTPTLADIYYQQGQYKLALQVFARLLTQDPENARLQQRYNEIKTMLEPGTPLPVSPPLRPASAPAPKKSAKPLKAEDVPSETRPLAGVRIKKRTKTPRK